ncbi:hypothetical protein EST38_g39 [Candolleomyces aberdarensis]|uniref:Protein phosphatase n=1 Tax=Candolleomyces aberdarensis TaxID=2316362 RepID=A0A4Q2E1L7_9AGAR|nr:hypothetical protein EST38_g39 [Candolleomyces aberdarensis]
MFTYTASPPKTHSHPHPAQSAHEPPLRAPKRQRLKYQLDVGAYGIAKRCRSTPLRRDLHTRLSPEPPANQELGLAVQVGEDAYFVRDNAMGVADGVGGWAKRHNQDGQSPTPSALFARRLMHYCSEEVDSATCSRSTSPAPPAAGPVPSHSRFSFEHQLKPRSAPIPILSPQTSSWLWNEAEEERLRQEELEQELQDSLDDLSEGIDVLQILEQAYDRAIKAHVAPPVDSSSSAESLIDPLPRAQPSTGQSSSSTSSFSSPLLASNSPAEHVPLMSGSSTALLAVLDHAPRHTAPVSAAKPSLGMDVSSSGTTPDANAASATKSAPVANYAAGTLHSSITLNHEQDDTCDAVIRVAHIGDCMGMLVRGEEIVWRSEEMWWDWNMPLQLGPVTHPTVTPSTAAHYFTLPVRADDILILASDGLSDNLWDEEVLDEVIKFRRSFLGASSQPEAEPKGTAKNSEKDRMLRRKTLAGMLSEALCSRAKKVAERRWSPKSSGTSSPADGIFSSFSQEEPDEVPFARRAREAGRVFRGGKQDDISVIVAVISPAEDGPVMLRDNA